jgi:hypothetical protein
MIHDRDWVFDYWAGGGGEVLPVYSLQTGSVGHRAYSVLK